MSGRYMKVLAAGSILLLSACAENSESPEPAFEGFVAPVHFPEPVYDFANNPPTKAGFDLGRQLFYEVRLSRGAQVSCGSCHAQVHAFADHNVALSTGVDGRAGSRNTPALSNLAWIPHFMWDGGINHIEVMPLAPITDPNEMDMQMNEALKVLREDESYKAMFRAAFGDEKIDSQRLLHALAQFQGLMVSDQSDYDAYIKGEKLLSESEMKGMQLFETHCSACHKGALQSDFSFRNNGLDSTFTDKGRMRITNNLSDLGKFRVPSLRNIAWSYPYMHDGRFGSLGEVLMHYAGGIVQSASLDQVLPPGGIGLTDQEQADIIHFLHTLTDVDYMSDQKFAEP